MQIKFAFIVWLSFLCLVATTKKTCLRKEIHQINLVGNKHMIKLANNVITIKTVEGKLRGKDFMPQDFL